MEGRPAGLGHVLVVFGLTGFAISQPLLSLLGDNPAVFTFHRLDGLDLVLFGLVVVLFPPVVLSALVVGASAIGPRTGRAVFLGVCGVLVVLAVIQQTKSAGLTSAALVALVSLAAGVGFVAAYVRYPWVATWARYTAMLPLLALVLFLFASRAGDLLEGPAAAETQEANGEDVPPVVVVFLDELPTKSLLDGQDGIDPVRFPNLARFAGDATWYRHFTSVSHTTEYAIPTMLTGKNPILEPPLYTSHPDNLFRLLAPTHDLHAFESFTRLCGVSSCEGAAEGEARWRAVLRETADVWRDRVSFASDEEEQFDQFEEQLDPARPDLPKIFARPTRLTDFVESLRTPDEERRPGFHFLHVVLPHSPFRFYQDGTQYIPAYGERRTYPFAPGNDQGEWISALTEQRHLLQAQYVDGLVGEILDTLESTDRYDESLVVLAADHGASFELETPFRRYAAESLDNIAYAPLLVKEPAQTSGQVDDSNLMAVDLLPTIADLVGVDVPWKVDGAAAGSRTVEDRGQEKYFYDIFENELLGVRRYDDAGAFPKSADRWIGPIAKGADPISGLHERLEPGARALIGRPFAELVAGREGRASVTRFPRLRRPGTEVRLGTVSGQVVEGPAKGTLLVSVNGTVVTGSPLITFKGEPGWFHALLPSDALQEENEVRVGLVEGDRVIELDVAS